ELIDIQNHINSINLPNVNIYETINSLDKEELIKVQNHINSINLPNINIYETINSLDKEELIKVQNHINSLNLPNVNIYKIIDSLDQEESIKIQNYIDSIHPKIENLINMMVYSKGKLKGEILFSYLQNKANEFVTSGLFKHSSSVCALQDKINRLKTENKKPSENIFQGFNLLLKNQKKLQKVNFKRPQKKIIKQNNHKYTAKFVKLVTNMNNAGSISLSATVECTKAMVAFFIGETPKCWLSTGTLSRWNKEVAKISLQQN
ncbi:14992_t:CDS:2, partial [Dentiscutata erythropus]